MQFRDIIGQEELKRRLVASVAAGRVSHAQLFSGAAGYGTLALAVAYVVVKKKVLQARVALEQ